MINGNKVRVEDNNPAISTGQGFSRHQRIETFDGIESLSLFPSGISSDATPIAIRYEKSPKVEAGIPEPVYLHFRGLDAAFRMFAINTFKATGRMKMIDGVNCAEYERPMMADSVSKIWFDPTKDNVAVRVESEINGRVSHRTIVSYRNNQVGGWTPTHWRTEDLNPDGSPKYVRECEITRLVVNDPVDDREFKVELKPGTYVQDQNTKKDYRVNDDGSLRELSAAEQFGPPKRTTIRQWVARNAWTIVLVASVVLFCLLPVIVRRRARPVASQAA